MSDPVPDPAPVREAAQAAVDAYFDPKGGVLNLAMPRLRAALAARPGPSASGSDTDDWLANGAVRVFDAGPSGDADAEWTKAWLRAKADVLAAINRGPDRVAVEGLLDYHGPLLRAAAPSDGAGGLDVALVPTRLLRTEWPLVAGQESGYPFTELVASIRAEGIREPLTAKLDWSVIDGAHRLSAARLIGLDTVPVRFWTGTEWCPAATDTTP